MSELKEQRYIVEIAKVQGIAKAAEKLYISQPALSKFLNRTEEMYGIKLFDRVGKKLVPTYAGNQYLRYASQILELDNNFQNQIADIKTQKKGSITFGSTPGRGKTIFPYILPEFYKKYPEFELKIYQETAAKLDEMILKGEIQVAMMTREEEDRGGRDFYVEEIATEEICLIAPKKKNLKGIYKYGFSHPWIDIRQLEQECFLLLNKGSRLRSVTDKILRFYEMGINTIEFNSIDTIWELVGRDFGVAFAADFQPPQNIKVDIFSVGTRPITWKFVVVTRVGEYISVPVQDIINITKRLYKKEKQTGWTQDGDEKT